MKNYKQMAITHQLTSRFDVEIINYAMQILLQTTAFGMQF